MTDFRDKVDSYLAARLVQPHPSAEEVSFSDRLRSAAYAAIHGMTEEELALRSMSLVYTTLLSIVPILALSFSVLKAFGVHTEFEIFLYYFLEPLGKKGVDLSMKIIGFIENIKVSVLGSIGLSVLVYTVISQIQKVEQALNYIWGIRRTRSFANRFSNYLSVVLIGPVFVFSAIGLTASLMRGSVVDSLRSIYPLGSLIVLFAKILPYLLATAGFAFIYLFLPNTKVRVPAALAGGIVAGVSWKVMGMVFTAFVASSAKYSAIYSGFAIIILFLIWLYWTWLVLLIGARVSAAFQHPGTPLHGSHGAPPESTARERAALGLMLNIGLRFDRGKEEWNAGEIAHRLGISPSGLDDMLDTLSFNGLIVPTDTEPPAYLPARPLEKIPVVEILKTVRSSRQPLSGGNGISAEAERVMMKVAAAIDSALDGETLKDLVEAAGHQS